MGEKLKKIRIPLEDGTVKEFDIANPEEVSRLKAQIEMLAERAETSLSKSEAAIEAANSANDTALTARGDAADAKKTADELTVALGQKASSADLGKKADKAAFEDFMALTDGRFAAMEMARDWDPETGSMYRYRYNDTSLAVAPPVDTSKVINFTDAYNGCTNLLEAPSYDFSSAAGSLTGMFYGCKKLRKVGAMKNLRVPVLGTNFIFCTELETFPEGYDEAVAFATSHSQCLGHMGKVAAMPPIDLSKSENLYGVFQNCFALEALTLKLPPEDRVLTGSNGMAAMFQGCYCLATITYDGNDPANPFAPQWLAKGLGAMNMFANCYKLVFPEGFKLDCSQTKRLDGTFNNCRMLKSVGLGDTSSVENFTNLFLNCYKLRHLPDMDWSSAKSTAGIAQDCTSIDDITYISNIGKNPDAATLGLGSLKKWGTETDEGLQSLKKSLIEDTFDRTAAGYPSCRLTLRPEVLAMLTDSEKARITAKGFTLATTTQQWS